MKLPKLCHIEPSEQNLEELEIHSNRPCKNWPGNNLQKAGQTWQEQAGQYWKQNPRVNP